MAAVAVNDNVSVRRRSKIARGTDIGFRSGDQRNFFIGRVAVIVLGHEAKFKVAGIRHGEFLILIELPVPVGIQRHGEEVFRLAVGSGNRCQKDGTTVVAFRDGQRCFHGLPIAQRHVHALAHFVGESECVTVGESVRAAIRNKIALIAEHDLIRRQGDETDFLHHKIGLLNIEVVLAGPGIVHRGNDDLVEAFRNDKIRRDRVGAVFGIGRDGIHQNDFPILIEREQSLFRHRIPLRPSGGGRLRKEGSQLQVQSIGHSAFRQRHDNGIALVSYACEVTIFIIASVCRYFLFSGYRKPNVLLLIRNIGVHDMFAVCKIFIRINNCYTSYLTRVFFSNNTFISILYSTTCNCNVTIPYGTIFIFLGVFFTRRIFESTILSKVSFRSIT